MQILRFLPIFVLRISPVSNFTMLKRSLLLLSASLMLAGALAACKAKVSTDMHSDTGTTNVAVSNNGTTAPTMTPVERGKYLVTVGGCNDCHTPWKPDGHGGAEPDMSKMLSGSPAAMVVKAPKLDMPWMVGATATMTAWSGPWGVSYSANLTPDSTGLGKWDEATFLLALKNGKHIGTGRPIMPPMPWQGFRMMTDDDLKSIFAFLKTIPAISNTPPAYQPPAGAPTAAAMPPAK
jgi:hypothetical protein